MENNIDFWCIGYLLSEYEEEPTHLPSNKEEAAQFIEGYKVGFAGKYVGETWQERLKQHQEEHDFDVLKLFQN